MNVRQLIAALEDEDQDAEVGVWWDSCLSDIDGVRVENNVVVLDASSHASMTLRLTPPLG